MKTIHYIIFSLILILFSVKSFAGGFIIVSPNGTSGWVTPSFNPYSLEVKSLKVDVDIFDLSATTTIEQVFFNPSTTNLQGWFFFPVPKGAILKNFSMEINGKMMEAELLDSDKARKIYEDIVRKLLDPALLEYSEQNLFKVRIFPIEAQKEKRIKISYTEILEKDNNTLEYFFPLNTEKYSAKPLKNISFKINVKESSKITTLYSPTHKTEVNRVDEKSAVIGFEETTVSADNDFKLFIGLANSDFGISVLSYKEENEDGFFLLNISPAFINKKEKISDKDITFILDVSGSMSDEKMEQAKKALLFCVSNLREGDNFEIVKFSTLAYAFFEKRVPANKENIEKAKIFINSLKPIGGTNMQEAFELACKEKVSPSRPHFIIFITDGKPTIGETQDEKLLEIISKSNSDNTRIFTFGVGDDINTHLLDKITENTQAFRSYIATNEDIEIKISNFYTKISSPILTDINVSVSGTGRSSEMFPLKIQDFFVGSSQTILGKFDKTGKSTVTLTGKLNGKEEKFTYEIEFKATKDNEFIPVLWATRKIGFLLDQIRLNGSKQELVDEVTQLAKKYGIITPYTSYLILEDEKINISNNNFRDRDIIFQNRFAEGDDFAKRSESEYNNMSKVSGSGSIQTSKEFQNLEEVNQVSDISQGASRMIYKGKSGKNENLANDVKSIKGRAFYQTGDKWIDVYYVKNSLRQSRIQFAGKEYFELLENQPEISKYLALGKNVNFIHNNISYEVYE